jgi:hypothetical protein
VKCVSPFSVVITKNIRNWVLIKKTLFGTVLEAAESSRSGSPMCSVSGEQLLVEGITMTVHEMPRQDRKLETWEGPVFLFKFTFGSTGV